MIGGLVAWSVLAGLNLAGVVVSLAAGNLLGFVFNGCFLLIDIQQIHYRVKELEGVLRRASANPNSETKVPRL